MLRTRWLPLAAAVSIPLFLASCRTEESAVVETTYDGYGTQGAAYRSDEEYQTGSGVIPGGDGVLVTLDAPPEAYAGEPIDFTVRVVNQTRMTARKVQIEADIAPELQITEAPDGAWDEGSRVLQWRLDSLEPGAEVVLCFRAIANAPGRLENCVDLRHTFGVCTETEVVAPNIECVVTAPPEVVIGEPICVILEARSTGTGTAMNVVGNLEYSPNLDLGSAEGQPAGPGMVQAIAFGDIPCGEIVQRQIEFIPNGPGAFSVVLHLQATPNLSTSCSAEGQVLAPQLAVEKRGPESAYVGTDIEYQIRVTNTGSGPAYDVCLTEVLPEGCRLCPGPDGQASGNWAIGDLQPGESRDVAFVLRAFREGMLENCVVATARGGLRAESCVTTEVFGIPAMHIENLDTQDPVPVGESTTYRITVTNQGEKPTSNVQVQVQLPPGSEFVQGNCELAQCSFEAESTSAIFQPVGDLPAGQSIIFDVTVRFLEPGDMVCSAVLTFDEFSKPVRAEEGTTVFGPTGGGQ